MSSGTNISGEKLFFYRTSSKKYGLSIVVEDGAPTFIPLLDVLGLLDQIERVLDISEDKKREQYVLDFLRNSPEWSEN